MRNSSSVRAKDCICLCESLAQCMRLESSVNAFLALCFNFINGEIFLSQNVIVMDAQNKDQTLFPDINADEESGVTSIESLCVSCEENVSLCR